MKIKKIQKFVIPIVTLFILVFTCFSYALAQNIERSYLVMAQTNKIPETFDQEIASLKGSLTKKISEIGIAVVTSTDPEFASKASKIKGVRSVSANVKLSWINPDTEVHSVSAEYGNPPASGDDDHLFNLQWGHDAIDAPEAWAKGERGNGVRVAVLDTGIDPYHPDLAPNLNTSLCQSFVPGEAWYYYVLNEFSHGSHVSGIIAAADNGWGIIGVAPEAELVMVKVLSAEIGCGYTDWILSGIIYAANINADIINMSLGGVMARKGYLEDNCTPDNPDDDYWVSSREVAEIAVAHNRATNYAHLKGATIIASAGNDGDDRDHDADQIVLPADSAHVLSISATAPIGWAIDPGTDLDIPTFYTNFGQSAIDFAAPGGTWECPCTELCQVSSVVNYCFVFDLVFSAGASTWENWPNIQYYWAGGTSMAAPHVSGVAAIIIGKNGGSMHPDQVEAALRKSADDLGKPGKDDYYGHGRVNAYKAISED